MNADQFAYLKRVAVSAENGYVVTDKHGGRHAILECELTPAVSGWLYQLGATGPSPALARNLLDKLADMGGTIRT